MPQIGSPGPDRRPLRLTQPFHSPFYAPLFVGLSQGFFAAEGLDVTVETSRPGRTTVDALLAGHSEIGLGGIMRSLDLADRGGEILPHFAEVNGRNGFFLLARRPRPDFEWRDLLGGTVISFAEAPTPWQCMLTVLRRHGVDPARVTIRRDLPLTDAVARFTAGEGDYLEQAQPTTEQLVSSGRAHVVASMGDATGPVPFSSYMTTRRFLVEHRDVVLAFTRAVVRTQRYLASRPPEDIARGIGPAFPDVRGALLTTIVERYLRQSTWPRTPVISRSGYEYLQQILLDGGFIKGRHRYEDLVDVELARRALAEVDPEG
jgi:NitT/TauT family transport system substrate-binding protein